MSRRTIPAAFATAILTVTLAACGGGGASSAPTAAEEPVAPSVAGGVCNATNDAGAVPVSIVGFAFDPAAITAAVGDVITFTNDDTTAHTATLVDGSCSTSVLGVGQAEGLVFTAPGSYPFRCDIHKQMTGTITIS